MNIVGIIICVLLVLLLKSLSIYYNVQLIKTEKGPTKIIAYILIVGIIGVMIISLLN